MNDDGIWQELADRHMLPVAKLIEATTRAARLLGKVSDDIWNAVGRPANDPALSVIFPGGVAYYTPRDGGGPTPAHGSADLTAGVRRPSHPRSSRGHPSGMMGRERNQASRAIEATAMAIPQYSNGTNQ